MLHERVCWLKIHVCHESKVSRNNWASPNWNGWNQNPTNKRSPPNPNRQAIIQKIILASSVHGYSFHVLGKTAFDLIWAQNDTQNFLLQVWFGFIGGTCTNTFAMWKWRSDLPISSPDRNSLNEKISTPAFQLRQTHNDLLNLSCGCGLEQISSQILCSLCLIFAQVWCVDNNRSKTDCESLRRGLQWLQRCVKFDFSILYERKKPLKSALQTSTERKTSLWLLFSRFFSPAELPFQFVQAANILLKFLLWNCFSSVLISFLFFFKNWWTWVVREKKYVCAEIPVLHGCFYFSMIVLTNFFLQTTVLGREISS